MPGTGVTVGCEPSDMGAWNQTSKSSLQLHKLILDLFSLDVMFCLIAYHAYSSTRPAEGSYPLELVLQRAVSCMWVSRTEPVSSARARLLKP